MNFDAIPDDLRRFILLHVYSIPYIEAILLFHNDVEHQWNFEEIKSRLFVDKKTAEQIILRLHKEGIIVIDNKGIMTYYRYHPKSEKLKIMIDRLADLYKKNLIEVTQLIHSNIDKKAENFANAFLLKKKKDF